MVSFHCYDPQILKVTIGQCKSFGKPCDEAEIQLIRKFAFG